MAPSRIRRKMPLLAEPVLDPRDEKQRELRKRELEMWGGVTGVVLFATAIAMLVVAIGAFTFFRSDPEAEARAKRFNQCYNATGPNCVLDGNTIYIQRERVQIAGLESPRIQGAECAAERAKGVSAAVALADLLNRGKVTANPAFRDAQGREVRKVAVNGEDVAATMIDAGVARKPGETADWC